LFVVVRHLLSPNLSRELLLKSKGKNSDDGVPSNKGSFTRPPQINIPGSAFNKDNEGLAADKPVSRRAASPVPTISERESVLSPSKIHMGVGVHVPNLRDALPNTSTIGVAAIKVRMIHPIASNPR